MKSKAKAAPPVLTPMAAAVMSKKKRTLAPPQVAAAPKKAARVRYDGEERGALEVLEAAQKRVEAKKAAAGAQAKRAKRTPAHKTMHGVDNDGVHNENSSARQADRRSEIDRDADHPRTWTRSTQLGAPATRPGMVQKWVRYRGRNESGSVTQDTDNLERYLDEGWRPRKRETVRRGHELTTDHNDKYASCYVKRGLILMELPEELAAQRNRAYAKRAQRMTEGIDRNMFKLNHPAMPMLQPSRTTRVSQSARRGSLEDAVNATADD